VHLRNPSFFTPLSEGFWEKSGARSLTLGSDSESNAREIARFSRRDAEVTILSMEESPTRHWNKSTRSDRFIQSKACRVQMATLFDLPRFESQKSNLSFSIR